VSPADAPLIPPCMVVESPGTWMIVEWSGGVVVSRIMSGRKDRYLYMAASLKAIRCYSTLYCQYYNLSNIFNIKQPSLEMNRAVKVIRHLKRR
jgi:hypothetical protein